MTDETRNLYGVNFLVALLTRFPELDEVSYLGSESRVKLGMDFSPQGDRELLFQKFEVEFEQIIKAFGMLEASSPTKAHVEIRSLGEKWWQISILFSLREIQLSFLLLLIPWWRGILESCEFTSIKELERLSEDERLFQEEMIENTLQGLINEKVVVNLQGIRENNQILVFKKNK